jgi:hypothetical protein
VIHREVHALAMALAFPIRLTQALAPATFMGMTPVWSRKEVHDWMTFTVKDHEEMPVDVGLTDPIE